MYLEINLGNKCNLNCKYCYVHGLIDESRPTYDLEYLYRFLDNLDTIESIRFTGGEPSLYLNEIGNIVSRFGHKIQRLLLITNGILLDKIMESALEYYTNYGIVSSIIMSVDKLGFDEIRGVDGDKLIDSILIYKQVYNMFIYEINRVIYDQTDDEIESMNTKCERDIHICNIPARKSTGEYMFKENLRKYVKLEHLTYNGLCNSTRCCDPRYMILSIGINGEISLCRMLMNICRTNFKYNIKDEFSVIMKEYHTITNDIYNSKVNCLYEEIINRRKDRTCLQ